MEGFLKSLFEKKRKRKYLKSDDIVPKRTRQHWETVKKINTVSKNFHPGRSGESQVDGNQDGNNEDFDQLLASSIPTAGDSSNNDPSSSSVVSQDKTSTISQNLDRARAKHSQEGGQQDWNNGDSDGSPSFHPFSGSDSENESSSSSVVLNDKTKTAFQKCDRARAKESRKGGLEDQNIRIFGGLPGSSPSSSNTSENKSSSSSSLHQARAEEGADGQQDQNSRMFGGSPGSSPSNSDTSENKSSSSSSIYRAGAEESNEVGQQDQNNRMFGGSPGTSPSSSDSENDPSSSSSEVSEDERDNNRSRDGSNSSEHSNSSDNEEQEEMNDQERNNANEQETDAESENGANDEELGNGRNEENRDFNNGQNPNERPHSKLQEWIDSPLRNENITTPVNVSQVDLLYMALGLAKQNNDTNKAFNDAIKLLNNLFVTPVLPRSPYLLDKLVMSHSGTRLFFFCEKCAHDFGELDYSSMKEIVCPSCNAVNRVSDLRNAHYFCLFDIKFALETLLSDEKIRQALLTPNEAVQTTQNGVFTDIYSGSMYKRFVDRFGNAAEHVVSFHLNTDGSPLFRSSKCSIWPISLALNELPLSLRLKNLICAGLWFGKKKPPMNLFLQPFVVMMVQLAQGFQIRVAAEIWNMCAYVIGVSVDSGARGAVQGLKTHSGYDSCSWCCIHGVYLAGAVRFPLSNVVHRLRSHDDIVRMQYEIVDEQPNDISDEDDDEDSTYGGGVNAVSPLINLPGFDMVDGFFVEGMHCLHLGITKNAIHKWLEDYGCEYYIKDFEDEINRRIKSLRPPIDCRRMPRALDEKARYKARELENFLLFCIVPTLTNILPEKHIKIWLLFSQGIYLLYLTEIDERNVNLADALLKKFLVQWQETYGEESMTYNLHLLYHLAEHVARWGNLFASSAYCFESFIGFLKNVIRSQQGIPNQVIRSLSWDQALTILKPLVSEKARRFVTSSIASRNPNAGLRVGDSVLSGKPRPFVPNDEEQWLCDNEGIDINSCDQYREVIHNKCVFAPERQTNQTNNSVAQLVDKRLVLIRKIVLDRARSNVFLFVSLVHNNPLLNVPDIPLDKDDHLMRLIDLIEPNCMLIKAEELKIVCFRATFEHGDFVAPLPNVFNRN